MWMQLSSGNGPKECQYAVKQFAEKILLPFLNEQQLQYRVLLTENGDTGITCKSMLFAIDCDTTMQQAIAKRYAGTMQWVCKSPFRKKHKRNNWFFNCAIYTEPELQDFSKGDVTVTVTHSGGPGGQNVNKVATAITVVHNVTGLRTQAREERSQQMNKKLALARMQQLIAKQNEAAYCTKNNELWSQHNSVVRGNPVQVYSGMKFKQIN